MRKQVVSKVHSQEVLREEEAVERSRKYNAEAVKLTFGGDYSGAQPNAAGVGGSVAWGLTGLDVYKDVGDLAYGIQHWEWTWGHAAGMGLNSIALFPVIGAIKNVKHADQIKYVDEIAQSKPLGKTLDNCKNAPKGARGPATAWDGFDEALAGGPVRNLTTNRVKVTSRGIDVVERHLSRFGPDKANSMMVERLRKIANGEITPTAQDLNFYTHELREFVRYRRLGWADDVPANGEARRQLWLQTHSATLDDYGLPLRRDDLLYHPDALSFIGE